MLPDELNFKIEVGKFNPSPVAHAVRMLKSGVWSRLNAAAKLSSQQQRALKAQRPANEAKGRSRIKLVQLDNLINRRYTRTPLARALVNRIYLRFEVYKSKNADYAYRQVNDHLINRIRGRAFRKLHNLLVFDEPFVDRLIEWRSNDPINLFSSGVHFDEDGCPIYGRRFNSMFNESDNLLPRRANFYRLLDAKMHNPTVFFDFRPANVGYTNRRLVFTNLNFIVRLNLGSRRPFSFTFLNYQPLWNTWLEPTMSTQPNFIDTHANWSSTAFTHKDRKLIILMSPADKPLELLSGFDCEANYLIPLYTDSRSTNLAIQEHYIAEYNGKPNVKLVYVPIEGLVRDQFGFDFSFYYFTLLALKDGLSLRNSINHGYLCMNKGIQAYKEAEIAKFKSGKPFRLPMRAKRFPFKHFDNLEDELL